MSNQASDINWDLPEPFYIRLEASKGDIDGYGHINNATYLSWMSHCSFEHSAAVGLDEQNCLALNRGMAAIRHEIDYLISGYPGDSILVGNWVTANDNRLRAQRRFQIIREHDNATLVRCVSNYVCTDLGKGKPARMPTEFLSRYAVLPAVATALNETYITET